MFNKKNNEIPVQHYEGLEGFAQDYPCRIKKNENNLEVRFIKPETTVTIENIVSFEAIEEPRFMLKYHNDASRTDKGTKKYYLVVNYKDNDNTSKYVAFWGTAFEYKKFLDLQFN